MQKVNKDGEILNWNLAKRTIWLDKPITSKTSGLFQQVLDKLNQESTEDIFFLVNSEGGDFFASLDMINAINRSESKIILIVHGMAASGAFLLTQADYKKRVAVAGTKFVFHQLRQRFLEEFNIEEFKMCREFFELGLFNIAMTNGVQVQLFSKRGASSRRIWSLLEESKTEEGKMIGTGLAKDLKLIDQVISKKTFKKKLLRKMKE